MKMWKANVSRAKQTIAQYAQLAILPAEIFCKRNIHPDKYRINLVNILSNHFDRRGNLLSKCLVWFGNKLMIELVWKCFQDKMIKIYLRSKKNANTIRNKKWTVFCDKVFYFDLFFQKLTQKCRVQNIFIKRVAINSNSFYYQQVSKMSMKIMWI